MLGRSPTEWFYLEIDDLVAQKNLRVNNFMTSKIQEEW